MPPAAAMTGTPRSALMSIPRCQPVRRWPKGELTGPSTGQAKNGGSSPKSGTARKKPAGARGGGRSPFVGGSAMGGIDTAPFVVGPFVTRAVLSGAAVGPFVARAFAGGAVVGPFVARAVVGRAV